jgi:hypothetical protein
MTYQPPAPLELIGQMFSWSPVSADDAMLYTILPLYGPLPAEWIDRSERTVLTPPNAPKGETGGVRVVRSKTYGEVKPQYANEAATFRANRFAAATETLRRVVEAGFVIHNVEHDTYVRAPAPTMRYVVFEENGTETSMPFNEREAWHEARRAERIANDPREQRIRRTEEGLELLRSELAALRNA